MAYRDWRTLYLDNTSNRVFNTLQRAAAQCEFRGMTHEKFSHIEDCLNELVAACCDAPPLTLDDQSGPYAG